MVVITVIGLLVATVGVKLFGVLTKGKRTKVLSDIADIDKALKMYRLEKHRYPTELRDLLEPTRDFPDGFLDRVPKDPWDNEYIYERQQRKYLIKSLGADGQNGGEGEDEDISNQDRDDE
jgi:general secretion pathway protein G